ncbi:MAG: hypothetical protein ACREMY_24900, partial [bacterium]
MSEQLAFTRILADADEQMRAALNRHRERVQAWFDQLPVSDKDQLAKWMLVFEWDTCAALSAAAGDWHRTLT